MKYNTTLNDTELETVTSYVYENYKSYKDKELEIFDQDNIIMVRKHKTGGFLFLNKTILN